ncbi:MAG: TspO/MBR family protein [Candidatus Micrarchaeota archaeon]
MARKSNRSKIRKVANARPLPRPLRKLPAIHERAKQFSWLALAGFIIACELAGIIGAVFTTPAIPTWYASLAKPEFTPPSWVFGPAWTMLYALIGTAAYLVFRQPDNGNRSSGLRLFLAQMGLNVLWSVVFFGLQSPGTAFAIIAMLWFAIAATMAYFWRVSKTATALMGPYLAWVTFAAALNFGVWLLNP